MLIILDFDHTLFNTSRFKKELFSCLKDWSVTESLFGQAYHLVVNRLPGAYDWDINVHLQLLQKQINFPIEAGRKRIEAVIANTKKYIYSDSLWFLKRLRQDGHRLILASWGNVDFQKKKIDNSGLKPYFDSVVVSQKSKRQSLDQIVSRADQLVFITDNPKEMKIMIKDAENIIPILSKRRQAKDYGQILEGVPTFFNLKAIYNFLTEFSQIQKPKSFRSQIFFADNRVIIQFSKKII